MKKTKKERIIENFRCWSAIFIVVAVVFGFEAFMWCGCPIMAVILNGLVFGALILVDCIIAIDSKGKEGLF